jgi:hypothetical protein
MKRKIPIILISVLALIFITGCAHQPPSGVHPDAPGFLFGLWHGFTILFSFIASIFTDIRIYAFPNSGFTYDLGYFLGVSLFGMMMGSA